MKTFDIHYYQNPTGKKREWTHTYPETWGKIDYFCPNCGKKEVWHELSEGDYYVGEQYLCLACEHTFELPSGVCKATDESDQQRLNALRKEK